MTTNIAVIGLQWGDEGKGKIVDLLADNCFAVVRFQGGHNAGHTIKVKDQIYKLSLLPSGIIRGKLSVIGSGVVLDPHALLSEIRMLKEAGITIEPDKLYIADNTALILSCHKELDKYLEEGKGEKKIGTTGRGIGPAYEDLVGRRALRVCDLNNPRILKERLENLLSYQNILRRGLNLREFHLQELLSELEEVKDTVLKYSKPSFEITKKLMAANDKQGNIMFEGAQGALLDVSFGSYPFVTSSHTIAGQIGIGSGLSSFSLHKTLGVLKAYTTRVGSGPFPTELQDKTGELLRKEGAEVGTVTGRSRRCGWFDAALVKQSIQLCGVKSIALTKLDVLDKLEKIKIAVGYEIQGQVYRYLPLAYDLQEQAKPVYEEIEGWQTSTAGCTSLSNLPQNALNYIRKIEELCEVKVAIISTGPKREESIIVQDIFA